MCLRSKHLMQLVYRGGMGVPLPPNHFIHRALGIEEFWYQKKVKVSEKKLNDYKSIVRHLDTLLTQYLCIYTLPNIMYVKSVDVSLTY